MGVNPAKQGTYPSLYQWLTDSPVACKMHLSGPDDRLEVTGSRVPSESGRETGRRFVNGGRHAEELTRGLKRRLMGRHRTATEQEGTDLFSPKRGK